MVLLAAMSSPKSARGHIRQRGEAWELRAYGGTDPATGKERRVTRTFHGTRKEAGKALTALLGELDGGQVGHGGRRTFGEAFDRWLAANRARMSPGTVMTTEDFARRYLTPLRTRPVERITADELDVMFGQLLERLAPSTVARAAGIVHTVLEAARRWRWTARNAADDTQPVNVPKRRPTSPEAAVTRDLAAAALEHDAEFGLFVRVSAIVGGRRGEACGLRWSGVDLEGAAVTIERRLIAGRDGAGREVVVEREGTKTGGHRKVAIDARTVALLRAQHARQAERALMFGVSLLADGFVFSYAPDASEGWKPHTVSQRFRRFRDSNPAFAGVRLHDLRHYVASHLLDQGLPTVVVAQRVGHRSTRTTEDIYGHAVTATDRYAADLLAAALD